MWHPAELLCHAQVVADRVVLGDLAVDDGEPMGLVDSGCAASGRKDRGHRPVGRIVNDERAVLGHVHGDAYRHPLAGDDRLVDHKVDTGEGAIQP